LLLLSYIGRQNVAVRLFRIVTVLTKQFNYKGNHSLIMKIFSYFLPVYIQNMNKALVIFVLLIFGGT
jgi:hypothetical protein